MATLFFDRSSGTSGFGTLSGNWLGDPNWTQSDTGAGANTTWAAAPSPPHTVNFGATAATQAIAGNVQLNGNVTIGGLLVNNLSGNQTISGSNTITLSGIPDFTINNSELLVAPNISGTAGFNKLGSSFIRFTGSLADLTGTVTVNGTSPGFFSAGVVFTAPATSTSTSFAVDSKLNNNAFIYVPTGRTWTFSGNLTGAGYVTHIDDNGNNQGTLRLTGDISGLGFFAQYYPAVTETSSLPQNLRFVDAGGTFSTFYSVRTTVTAPSSYATNILLDGINTRYQLGAESTFHPLTITGRVTRATNPATFVLRGVSTQNNTLSGINNFTSGAAVAFRKEEAGRWIISADNSGANAFSSTAIAGGTLRAAHANALGGTITMSPNTELELAGVTVANTATLIGTVRSVSGTGSLSGTLGLDLAGTTTFEAASGAVLDLPSSGTAITGAVPVILGGAGTVSIGRRFSAVTTLTKNGSGVATIENTANAFGSGVTINSGVLAVPAIAALGTGTSLALNASGVLRYTGSTGGTLSRTLTGTSLSSGGFENTSSSSFAVTGSGSLSGTIKLGASNSSAQYNTLSATISSGGFTKEGDGRWIVTSVNNLSGATTVSAGTLMAAPATVDTSAKLLGGNVTVAAGAKVQISSDNGQAGRNRYTNLTFAGTSGTPARIRIGGSAINPTVQMSGDLTLSGAVTWDLRADTFKTPGTYRLFEFLSGQLTGGSSSLSNVTLQLPTGRTLAPGGLTYDGLSLPKTITVTIN